MQKPAAPGCGLRSVRLCTRNDLIPRLGVAAAGLLVWLTGWRWSSLTAGLARAGVFLRSALAIVTSGADRASSYLIDVGGIRIGGR